jgi:hypothetical protein
MKNKPKFDSKRNLFPEENYKDTSIGGLALKSLARNYSQQADELMTWMVRFIFFCEKKTVLKTTRNKVSLMH